MGGFRYAIIRDISFSADSKWMAVSSARGTLHIYAILREGGTPSFRSHNNCYSIHSIHDHHRFGAMDSLTIDINKIIELQSQKKLHHEMKETRKDPKGSNTTTGGTKIISTFSMFGEQTAFGSMSLLVQTPVSFHQYSINCKQHKNVQHDSSQNMITKANETNNICEKRLFLDIDHLHEFTSRDLYNAHSVSYPYLHDQLYPQSTPNIFALSSNNAMISAFNLDETNSEDTKRWLAQTELHPINRFHQVSLWGNPQFNFYSYLNDDIKSNDDIPDIEEYQDLMSDPYSFLDVSLIDNATPIKLHEDSPIIGPRLNQPQIQTQISDLQQTIDSAMDTVIDDEEQRHIVVEDEDEFDAEIPVLTKSKSIESDNDCLNDNELSLMLNEKYCKNLSRERSKEMQINDEHSQTGSDDFQIVD